MWLMASWRLMWDPKANVNVQPCEWCERLVSLADMRLIKPRILCAECQRISGLQPKEEEDSRDTEEDEPAQRFPTTGKRRRSSSNDDTQEMSD